MNVPYKQKEFFERDLRSYKDLNKEWDKLFDQIEIRKKFIFVLSIVIILYFLLPKDFYLLEIVLGINILWVFDFFRLRKFKNTKFKHIQNLVSEFEEKYGVHPEYIKSPDKGGVLGSQNFEFTFSDDEYLPWDYIKTKVLVEVEEVNTKIRLIIDPGIEGLNYSVSGEMCQKLYGKPNHKISYRIGFRLKKSHLIKLEEIFNGDLDFMITPHLIETFFEDYKIPFEKWVYSEEFEEFNSEPDDILVSEERVILNSKWEIDGGIEDQIVTISKKPNGTVIVHESNSGPKSEQFFGKDENEYWIEVNETHVIDFLQVVLERSFNKNDDDPLTIKKIEGFLKEKGIPHEIGVW